MHLRRPRSGPIPSLAAIVPATDSPETLTRCLAAIEAAADGPEEVVVVAEPGGLGPAGARNAGARLVSADVLVFIDADTEVHADVFTRVGAAFSDDDRMAAVFGSLRRRASGAGRGCRGFRNLLHHHVHQPGRRAGHDVLGLGARCDATGRLRRTRRVRRGGRRYALSIEDIELGSRMARAGLLIRLDPELQATHLKAWTLRGMVVTDLRDRAIPWLLLVARGRADTVTLNLGWRHRASAAAALAATVALAARRPGAAVAATAGLVALNRDFYALLGRAAGERGRRSSASFSTPRTT